MPTVKAQREFNIQILRKCELVTIVVIKEIINESTAVLGSSQIVTS